MYLYKICTYIVCWDFKVFCLTMHSPEKQNQTFRIIILKIKKRIRNHINLILIHAALTFDSN